MPTDYWQEQDIQPTIDASSDVTATVGAVTAKVLWDDPDDAELQTDIANVFGAIGLVTAKRGTFAVTVGGTITITKPVSGAVTYTVTEVRQLSQGLTRFSVGPL